MAAPEWAAPRQIPVSIVTGFLGAGKTTLINRMIGSAYLSQAALIVNEFGEVGIDHLLVERSGDGVIELSDGCLCCTVRGELVDTLADLMDRRQTGRVSPFSRVVIETTGLADPIPVLQAVIGHPVLSQSYRLEGVLTVVDGVNGLSTLQSHEEARRQVAVADRLILTKTALAEMRGIDTGPLKAALARLNPRAPLLEADRFLPEPESLFGSGAYDPAEKSMDVVRWLGEAEAADHHEHGHGGHDHAHHDHAHHDHAGHDHAHHAHHRHDPNRHGETIRAESIRMDAPIQPAALGMFLDLVRSAHGPKLLRMKGIVKLADDPTRPVVIHAVQSLMAEPVRLARWPEGAGEETRIVAITDGMPADFLADLFGALADQPAVGRPDRQALTDNPLAIPGGSSPLRG